MVVGDWRKMANDMRLATFGLIVIGCLQVIQDVHGTCTSSDTRCVPTAMCESCRQMKCQLAQEQGLGNGDCSNASPLTGGNQCCDSARVRQLSTSRRKRQAYNFFLYPNRQWPNPISYAFDTNFNDPGYQTTVLNVLSYISMQTCIRFSLVDLNAPFSHIVFSIGSSCSAYVGRSEQNQTVILATPDCASKFGEMLYLVVQTCGLWHQSQRPDRDSYTTINTSNTQPEHVADFAILNSDALATFGLPYDMASIQQFPALIFTRNGDFTIVTNDPLYQQTIGQRVQLSFQDSKLLNLLYCNRTCSAGQLPGTCQSGGYQDPNNCTQCKCPDGYTGRFCDKFGGSTGAVCGGNLNASLSEMYITSPGYVTPGYYDAQQFCVWHIAAPAGQRVILRFVDAFGIYQDISYACYHWAEVRYNQALNQTGPRFCGTSLPQAQLVSTGSEVLLIFQSNLTGIDSSQRRGFKIAYKIDPASVPSTAAPSTSGPVTRGSSVPTEPLSTLPAASTTSGTPTSCNPNPCRNNGTCAQNGTGVKCTCPNGFSGPYCTKAPCGGCNVPPGVVDDKCTVPESPPRVCQVIDFVATTSGWWPWCRTSYVPVKRNVTCTWSVCCDNAVDFGCGCGVLGWTDWCSCSASCGGGTQLRSRYGTRRDFIGNLYYDIVQTDRRNCSMQKCVCSSSSSSSGSGRGGGSRGRGGGWFVNPPCTECNGPSFVASGDQCVPRS